VLKSVENDGLPYKEIPKDLLSLETTEMKISRESVNQLASRIWFMSDDFLRVVNKQGQDVIICAKYLEVLSIVKIDNFNL
jgi:formyltetrahydrofolate hydrolase